MVCRGQPVDGGHGEVHAAAIRAMVDQKSRDHIFQHSRRPGLVVIDLHQMAVHEARAMLEAAVEYRGLSVDRGDGPWKLYIGVGAGKHSEGEVSHCVPYVAVSERMVWLKLPPMVQTVVEVLDDGALLKKLR